MEKFLSQPLLLTRHIPLFQCMNLKGEKGAFFLKKMWCCVVVREGEGGRCNKIIWFYLLS